MAKVHLVAIDAKTENGVPVPEVAFRLRQSQRVDRFGIHSLTDDPAAADLILFVRPLGLGAIFAGLVRHPLVRRFRQKCYLYDANDRIVPVLPGIFPGVERRWYARGRTRSGAYLVVEENPFLDEDHQADERKYLYSFAGTSQSAEIRRQLGHLTHPRGICRDTHGEGERTWRQGGPEDRRAFRRSYLELTWASKFVLCPRGFGVSSIRLFETMRAGRAPVILSDDWVPPEGPCWPQFSLRVSEADWALLPDLLEARENEAAAMGQLARRQWEEWFSEAVLFHRMVEDCLSIGRARGLPEPLASWIAYWQMMRPSHLRHWARQTGMAQRIKDAVRFKGLRR